MIALIVAHDKNKVIGNQGKIPWNIPGEQTRFRELTTGNVVVMGRKTYEDIGHPLPHRSTIVVSTKYGYESGSCTTVNSLSEALERAKERNVFIAGGERLYKEAIPMVEKMYVTEIDGEFDGDAYFPEFDKSQFERKEVGHIEGEIPYTYVEYTRKK